MNDKEFQAKLGEMKQTLISEQQQVADRDNQRLAAITKLEGTVQELKDKIATSGQTDFQPYADQIDSFLVDLKATVTVEPTTPPVIEPPVIEPSVVEPPVIEPPVTPEEPA